MNFSKVKTVICLGLVVVNIILGIMCLRLVSEKKFLPEEEVQLAKKHLEENGIYVDYSSEDRKLYNLPIYAANTDKSEDAVPEIYKTVTTAFFDTAVEESEYVKTPDGYSVSVKQQDGKLLGISSFSKNTGICCYFEELVSDSEIFEIQKLPVTMSLETSDNNGGTMANAFMEKIFFNSEMKFSLCGTKPADKGTVYCFSMRLSDTDVIDVYMNIYIKNGRIVSCSGNLIDAVPQKKYSSKLIDSVDVMYHVRDYICEKNNDSTVDNVIIEEFSLKYKVYEYAPGSYYIIPTWIVEYSENGSKNERGNELLAVDAVTGENRNSLK